MIIPKGSIKKSRIITGGSITKVRSKPIVDDNYANPSTDIQDVPRDFLVPYIKVSPELAHNDGGNVGQYDDALRSLSFYGRRKEKKEGVRLRP